MNNKTRIQIKKDKKAKSILLNQKSAERKLLNDISKMSYKDKLILFMEHFEIKCPIEGRRKFNQFQLNKKRTKVPSKYIYGVTTVFRG